MMKVWTDAAEAGLLDRFGVRGTQTRNGNRIGVNQYSHQYSRLTPFSHH